MRRTKKTRLIAHTVIYLTPAAVLLAASLSLAVIMAVMATVLIARTDLHW